MSTTKKKPSAAQLRARALFVKRVKSGEFARKTARKNPAAKKRAPTKRKGPAKINSTSQATGRAPTKRLKARRASNTKAGYFPNPRHLPSRTRNNPGVGLKFKVQHASNAAGPWATIASFARKEPATEYAKALSKTRRYKALRIDW